MTHTHTSPHHSPMRGRWVILTAGLVVALGAAVATAHGLYEVAIAATVPAPIAWLYPLITDGLALVAYASTTRLAAGGRGYAWAIVVLAAGLSGLAQASYLAIGVHSAPTELRFGVGAWPAIAAAITAHLLYLLAAVGPAVVQPAEVGHLADGAPVAAGQLDGAVQRPSAPAGVGQSRAVHPDQPVQPAVQRHDPLGQPDAAARRSDVGQLSGPQPSASAGMPDGGRPRHDSDLRPPVETVSDYRSPAQVLADTTSRAVQHAEALRRPAVHVGHPTPARLDVEQPGNARPVQPDRAGQREPVQSVRPDRPQSPAVQPVGQQPGQGEHPSTAQGSEPPIDRARAAALAHQASHGDLPSVSQLAAAAGVARGTAATALKRLREQPPARTPGLHIVHHDDPTGTS